MLKYILCFLFNLSVLNAQNCVSGNQSWNYFYTYCLSKNPTLSGFITQEGSGDIYTDVTFGINNHNEFIEWLLNISELYSKDVYMFKNGTKKVDGIKYNNTIKSYISFKHNNKLYTSDFSVDIFAQIIVSDCVYICITHNSFIADDVYVNKNAFIMVFSTPMQFIDFLENIINYK